MENGNGDNAHPAINLHLVSFGNLQLVFNSKPLYQVMTPLKLKINKNIWPFVARKDTMSLSLIMSDSYSYLIQR